MPPLGILPIGQEKKECTPPSTLGLRALFGGTLACLFTAVLVGMFLA